MPDASGLDPIRPASPSDWGEAFAQLPLEVPPASAWPALATGLARGQRHRRIARHLALAASLGAVLLVPVVAWRALHAPAKAPVAVVSTSDDPTPQVPATPRDLDAPPPLAQVTPTRAAVAAPVERASRRPPQASTQTRPVSTLASRHPRAGDADVRRRDAGTPVTPSVDTDAQLAALQTESAQLEDWLRTTGAGHVAAAPSLVLTAALDDELQRIDGVLAQPSLDGASRAALWSSRVQTLREVAALETAQRWRNAQGVSMDAALVRVD